MKLEEKVKGVIRNVNDYPKSGIVFKDITPVLADPELVRMIIQELVQPWKHEKVDAIAAVEARGFIFGGMLAHEMQCGFIPVRKSGKLPYKTIAQEYALEYGTAAIEIHNDAFEPGSRILIHDDLLATGGTAIAAGQLIERLGGIVAGFNFLVNLSFLPGEQNLISKFGIKPQYLVSY